MKFKTGSLLFFHILGNVSFLTIYGISSCPRSQVRYRRNQVRRRRRVIRRRSREGGEVDHGVGLQRSGTPAINSSEVAQQLGCSTASVHRWQAAATPLDPEVSLRMELGEDEAKRLRKENARLKMEIDILKKATAYFKTQSAECRVQSVECGVWSKKSLCVLRFDLCAYKALPARRTRFMPTANVQASRA